MLTKTPATPVAISHTQTSQNGTKLCTRTLCTVKQFCSQNPAFTQGGVRWLLFNREQNGLDNAVLKLGRRIFIDVDAFFAWLDEQNRRQPRNHNPNVPGRRKKSLCDLA